MKHIRQTALSTLEISLIEMRQIKIFFTVISEEYLPVSDLRASGHQFVSNYSI
jgi:hypothetical protein